MLTFKLDANTISKIQAALPAFQNVPTSNRQPVVVVSYGETYVSLVDLSTVNVCVFGQLENQINLYRRTYRIASERLDSAATATLRQRVSAFNTLLETQEFVPEWLMDDDEGADFFGTLAAFADDEPFEGPSKQRQEDAMLAIRLHMFGINPDAADSVKLYMRRKEISPAQLTPAVLTLLKGWYESNVELAVLENTPRLAEMVLNALLREQEARKLAGEYAALMENHQNTLERHIEELRNERVNAAISALRLAGIVTGKPLESLIRANFGEDADKILEAFPEPDNSNRAYETSTDWLAAFDVPPNEGENPGSGDGFNPNNDWLSAPVRVDENVTPSST